MLGPILDQIGDEYEGKVKICKVNVDENREYAEKLSVMGIPAVFFVKNGEVVEKFVGVKPKQDIIPLVEKVIALDTGASA
jgi:thioredoxin 1